MEDEFKPIFTDTGALIALYIKNDQYHKKANYFWKGARDQKLKFVTSNFIFDEATTWILYKAGKKTAIEFGEYILENSEILPINPVLPEDEDEGWKLFRKVPIPLSYTDCTSAALMKRIKLDKVFTFDSHFAQLGFTILPGEE